MIDIQLAWTDESDSETEFRVYRDTTSDVPLDSTHRIATVSSTSGTGSTVTHTDTIDESAQSAAYYAVTAYDSGTGLESGPSNEFRTELTFSGVATEATSALPDEDQPVLGNGVEDEVAVDRESVVSNYGDVRIQIRETGTSSWDSNATGFSEFIGDHSTLSMEFVGREDGEEYEVRARTETEHVTGAWADPVAIVTQFPGAVSLAATVSSPTSVDLAWTDQADNEDGQRVIRERRANGTWWPEETVDDAGINAEAYTDGTVQPGTEYRYVIEAFTEHTSARSNTDTATTATIAPQTQTGSGWTVEIDAPSGETLRPSVGDGVEYPPALNQRPEIRVPVPRSTRWSGLEGQPMRVWHDGSRLPIEELGAVEESPGEMTLVGHGAVELQQDISTEVDNTPHHEVARSLIDTVGYARSVDDPAANPTEELMQSADSESELLARLNETIAASDPNHVTSDGRIETHQTCWTTEGEEPDRTEGGAGSNYVSDTSYSGSHPSDGDNGIALLFDETGMAAEYDFVLDHEIPSGAFGLAWRVGPHDPAMEMEVSVDGQSLGTVTLTRSTTGWIDFFEVFAASSSDVGTLSPGTHTVRFEAVGSSGTWPLDVVAPHDARHHDPDTFDDTVTVGSSENYLDSPTLYPPSVPIEFTDVTTPRSVVGGRADLTISATDNDQALALSNDQGATWTSASNTSTIDVDFGSAGGSIRLRVTLSHTGSQAETPAQGIDPQRMDAFELFATLEDTPVVVARDFEGNASDILETLRRQGDFIWQATWSDSVEGIEIQWTQPGQRSPTGTSPAADFDVATDVRSLVEAATVIGGRTAWSERITANHGTAIALDRAHLIRGTVHVTDPSTGETFAAGDDYEVSVEDGEITTLSSGDISDGTELAVEFEFKPRGSYQAPTYSGDTRRRSTVRLSGLTTVRECKQFALRFVEDAKDPRIEASATVSEVSPTRDLTRAVDISELPVDELLQPQDVQTGASSSGEFRLEDRPPSGEVIDELRRRAEALSERV